MLLSLCSSGSFSFPASLDEIKSVHTLGSFSWLSAHSVHLTFQTQTLHRLKAQFWANTVTSALTSKVSSIQETRQLCSTGTFQNSIMPTALPTQEPGSHHAACASPMDAHCGCLLHTSFTFTAKVLWKELWVRARHSSSVSLPQA